MNSHPESRSNDSSSNHRSIAGITSEYFSIRVAINRYFSPIWSFYIKTDQWEKRHNNNEHNTMKRDRQREKKNHKHMHTEWFVIHHIIQRIPAQEHHQQHIHTHTQSTQAVAGGQTHAVARVLCATHSTHIIRSIAVVHVEEPNKQSSQRTHQASHSTQFNQRPILLLCVYRKQVSQMRACTYMHNTE